MNKFTLLIASLVLISGCRMNDALDSTIQMNAKMDATNKGMDRTNSGMSRTNESIHKQTLMVSLNEILKEENTLYLFPPIGMMPAGEAFGKEATPLEMIQVVYLWLKDINSSQADGVGPDADGTWPSKEVLDRKKTAKLTALEVIAGLAPQETVDQLIEQQVNQGGRFESTTYEFLMLRSAFIEGILIQESLFSKPMINPGMFEEGLKYIGQMESIAKLPFKGKIALKTIGFAIPDNNVDLKLDPASVKTRYSEMKNKITQIDQLYSSSTESAMKARIEAIKNAIDQGIARN